MLWIKHPLQDEKISFRTGVPYGVSYEVQFKRPYEVTDDAPYEGSDEMYTHSKCPQFQVTGNHLNLFELVNGN
jgi:hypothetical protein